MYGYPYKNVKSVDLKSKKVGEKLEKEDKRVRRTKRLLKEAFIELLKEKEFDKVTVTNIIEKADFNRTTFYNHYQDKYDLIGEIESELLDELVSATEKVYQEKNYLDLREITPEDFFLFDYIYEYKDYFILWKYQTDMPKFREKVSSIFSYLFNGKLKVEHNQNKLLTEKDMTLFAASGFMGLILEWINDDFKEDPHTMSIKGIELLSLFTYAATDVKVIKSEENS